METKDKPSIHMISYETITQRYLDGDGEKCYVCDGRLHDDDCIHLDHGVKVHTDSVICATVTYQKRQAYLRSPIDILRKLASTSTVSSETSFAEDNCQIIRSLASQFITHIKNFKRVPAYQVERLMRLQPDITEKERAILLDFLMGG